MNDQDKEALWCILDRNSTKEVTLAISLYKEAGDYNDPFDHYMKTTLEPVENGQ